MREVHFVAERQGFQRVKQCFPALQKDVQQALQELHHRYSTTVRENRFVVGGATEIVLGAAFRACGVPVKHRGTQASTWDLIFENAHAGYSVKSMLKSTTTRLINVQGRSPQRSLWNTATLFLIPQGIIYADPALPWWRAHRQTVIKVRSDALEIRRKWVETFSREHPDWWIPCDLALPRETGDRRHVRTASYDLAVQVLKDLGGTLFRHIPELLD